MSTGPIIIQAGPPGHEREITVSFEAYGYMTRQVPLPRSVEYAVKEELPETWLVENRGSRLEVHPSGHFAGGFDQLDVNAVIRAVEQFDEDVTVR